MLPWRTYGCGGRGLPSLKQRGAVASSHHAASSPYQCPDQPQPQPVNGELSATKDGFVPAKRRYVQVARRRLEHPPHRRPPTILTRLPLTTLNPELRGNDNEVVIEAERGDSSARVAQRAAAERRIGIRTASSAFLLAAVRAMPGPLLPQLWMALDGVEMPSLAQANLVAQPVG